MTNFQSIDCVLNYLQLSHYLLTNDSQISSEFSKDILDRVASFVEKGARELGYILYKRENDENKG